MKSEQDRPSVPYRPSWVDNLIARLDALPPLAVYLGLWLAMLLIAHLAAWVGGLLPRGAFDARILLVTAWAPYYLGFVAYLSHAAVQSLDDFQPALDLDEGAFCRCWCGWRRRCWPVCLDCDRV